MKNRIRILFLALASVLMLAACGPSDEEVRSWRTAADGALDRLLFDDAPHLRVSPHQVGRLLWMLTFSGSHPEISGGEPLSADDVVDTVLHGVLRTSESALREAL